MSFSRYIIMMIASTAVAWLAWVWIMISTNPEETGAVGFALFYITLTTGLIGALTLLGLAYRVLIKKRQDVIIREVNASFRQAMLLSFISVSALALSAFNLLKWWVLLVLIVIVSAIEYLFLTVQHSRRG